MTSSDESDKSFGLDDNLDGDDAYEITFRHTERGFKYRKDVLTKMRRSTAGGGGRTGREQARNEGRRDGFNSSMKEMLNLEGQVQELKDKYCEAKNTYILRFNELESLKAHLEELGQEICDYDTIKASRDTAQLDHEQYLKNQVIRFRMFSAFYF